MDFVDFTLLLSDPSEAEDQSVLMFDLQVPAAGALAAITEPIRRRCALSRVAPLMTAHPGRALPEDVLLAAGLELGQALLPDRVAGRLRQVFLAARARNDGVRIRILGGVVLQRIPWEYSVLAPEEGEATVASFLALMPRVSIVRDQEGVARAEWGDRRSPSIRVLGCFAAPRTTAALEIERERQILGTALAACPNVSLSWTNCGVRPSRALGAADLFHFAGHGGFEPATAARVDARLAPAGGPTRDIEAPSGVSHDAGPRDGMLIFDDGDGSEDRVRAGDLGIVLRELGVRVAVLNACNSGARDAHAWWSSTAAALLNSGIGSVVAMQHLITDASALAFADAFYRALASGRSLDEAVRDGRIAMYDRGDRLGWGTPVLYLSVSKGVAFPAAASVSSGALAVAPSPPPAPSPSAATALEGIGAPPRHLAWSVDSARLAASDGKGTCLIWDSNTRWRQARKCSTAAIARACEWLDTRLVIARGDRLHLVGGDDIAREFGHTEQSIECVIPLRSWVACIDIAGGAYLYEPTGSNGRLLDRAPLGAGPWSEAAVSPQGDTFAVATPGGHLAVWGPSRKLAREDVADGTTGLAFLGPDTLAVMLASGALVAFAIEKRRLRRLANLSVSAPVRPPFAVSHNRLAIATAANDVAIYAVAATSSSWELALVARLAIEGAQCLAWSPDGAWLAVSTLTTLAFHRAR
ncbi:MAG TPA: CHAT domain-containing protein [Kofleriaceae bacterium]|nr:CHAT domain-containing protein [Kofleriaceae bacterium]